MGFLQQAWVALENSPRKSPPIHQGTGPTWAPRPQKAGMWLWVWDPLRLLLSVGPLAGTILQLGYPAFQEGCDVAIGQDTTRDGLPITKESVPCPISRAAWWGMGSSLQPPVWLVPTPKPESHASAGHSTLQVEG